MIISNRTDLVNWIWTAYPEAALYADIIAASILCSRNRPEFGEDWGEWLPKMVTKDSILEITSEPEFGNAALPGSLVLYNEPLVWSECICNERVCEHAEHLSHDEFDWCSSCGALRLKGQDWTLPNDG